MKKSKNRFFRHRTPTFPNFFYSIKLLVDKVYDAKKNFWIAINYGKIGRKKWSEKSGILKKKIFTKNSKLLVFILHKVKLGGRTILFRCPLGMGCMGHGRKKYPKFVSKIPILTYRTLVHLDSTSNHSKSCRGHIFVQFCTILYNFEVKRTLFGEAGKIIPRWWFSPKKIIIELSSPIKMASIIRLIWKFASILRLSRAFKIAMKLDDRRCHFLTCLIFNDNRS